MVRRAGGRRGELRPSCVRAPHGRDLGETTFASDDWRAVRRTTAPSPTGTRRSGRSSACVGGGTARVHARGARARVERPPARRHGGDRGQPPNAAAGDRSWTATPSRSSTGSSARPSGPAAGRAGAAGRAPRGGRSPASARPRRRWSVWRNSRSSSIFVSATTESARRRRRTARRRSLRGSALPRRPARTTRPPRITNIASPACPSSTIADRRPPRPGPSPRPIGAGDAWRTRRRAAPP